MKIFKLEIDQDAKNSFYDMARWTKFLAIMGFIMLALMLAMGIFFAVFFNKFAEIYGGTSPIASLGPAGPILIIAVFIIFIGIYFYPTYALLRYSSCVKAAIATDDKPLFNKGIRYLKNMFRYIGIMTIIMIGLFAIDTLLGLVR